MLQPKRWIIPLLCAQVVYLIFELSFNARLVDSIMVSDADYFDQLSYLGRCISGIGFVLVCYSLIRYKSDRVWWKTMGILVVAGGLAFPVMFFGQEKLINHFVDQSSAEQRMHAQYLILLKKGLANNAVVLKGMQYEKEDLERPAVKTFISNLGFMVFFTPDYIQAVMRNSDQILEHIARQKANKKLDTTYPSYLDARGDVEKSMRQYNDANNQYVKQLNLLPKQAEDIWKDVFVSLQEQWSELQGKQNKDAVEDSLDKLMDGLEQYRLGLTSCKQRSFGQQQCLDKIEAVYQKKMMDNFSQHVQSDYWCQRIAGKMAFVMQGNGYARKMQSDRFVCENQTRDFLRQKMLKLKGKDGVYFESWNAFVGSKMVADQVRNKLAPQGIHMPEKYRIGSHKGFTRGVISELTARLKESFLQQSKKDMGQAIEPMLDKQAFVDLPFIQNPLKDALHLAHAHASVSMNLSELQFRDKILMPVITKELQKERLRLLASAEQFADGQAKEMEGKQYVRSVLVPPVAMGFSMFFALLNLSGIVAGIILLMGGASWLTHSLRGLFMLSVIILPLQFSGEIAQTATFKSIVDQTYQSIGNTGGGFIVWLSNLQPVIYPLGHTLAEGLNIFPVPSEGDI